MITIGELRLGVLTAQDLEKRDRRLSTYAAALDLDVLDVDPRVADAWARLATGLHRARVPIHDTWIAATALAHGAGVVTQDHDFQPFVPLGLVVYEI